MKGGTFRGLFSRLEARSFEAALALWVAYLRAAEEAVGLRAVALDGKTARRALT